MDNLGHEGQGGHQGHHGPGEEAEALAVVIVSVEGVPLEVVLIVHKVPPHAVPLQLEQAAVHPPPAQGHLDVAHKAQLVPPLVGHPLVEGKDHLHLVARFGQGLGQAAGHVGQSAGLAEGNRLRGGK